MTESQVQPSLSEGSSRVSAGTLPLKPARSPKPRARRQSIPRKQSAPPQPKVLLEGFCPEPNHDERLAVNSNGIMLFLSLSEIGWMEATDQSLKLHVGKHTHRIRDTLSAVAAKLPAGRFVRISRSTLVNVEHIQGLQRMFFNEYEVLLRNGKRLGLSRAYWENLRQIGLYPAESILPVSDARFTLGRPGSN